MWSAYVYHIVKIESKENPYINQDNLQRKIANITYSHHVYVLTKPYYYTGHTDIFSNTEYLSNCRYSL